MANLRLFSELAVIFERFSYLCTTIMETLNIKSLTALILTAIGLLSACRSAESPSPQTTPGSGQDSAAIYQEWAYQEMFADSLGRAETYAYRAVMLSNDSTIECGALALLSYIYYREGKQEELQLLMQTFSPETYMNIMDVQKQVEQAKAGRDRQYYVVTIILLLLMAGVVCYWYIRRVRLQSSFSLPIDETKLGIDVLSAIINDQNISQMGKQEEQAVLKVLPMVDATLAALLEKASAPLTPKETFFCIMEYHGKSDRQKARSFCCSEQAIRSTKSRLSKKIDITILRSV